MLCIEPAHAPAIGEPRGRSFSDPSRSPGEGNSHDESMGIGFSIFLLAVGAILAFDVNATVAGLDISLVGWILMAPASSASS